VRPPLVVLRDADGAWHCCERPVEIVSTHSPHDVANCLDRIAAVVRPGGLRAAGFVSYEAAEAFALPVRSGSRNAPLPLVWFGIFPDSHVTVSRDLPVGGPYRAGEWRPSISRDEYLDGIARIKTAIAAGDTYQINFTFRLRASFEGDPLGLMADLFAAQAGPWSAFVNTGDHAICSASPEVFFRRRGDRLECRPMKGTAPRGLWTADDLARATQLHDSEKNRAENVMVVDMTRNDLGRLARTGSVQVPTLFDVERYPGQWQMTSTVTASVDDTGAGPIFAALFPSGSVTGAPKRSSMKIIRDLETTPRGLYTGAIGSVSADDAAFNVAIRTVVIDLQQRFAEFGVGSGVVWDSVDRDEYDECLNKAAMLTRRVDPFALIETFRWDPAAGFVRLSRHIDRLRGSAAYFGFTELDHALLAARLDTLVAAATTPLRVRLQLERSGDIDLQCRGIEEDVRPMSVALADEPVSSSDVFLFHKTTRREVYERARARRPDVDAVLLWNERGEITEATEANVVCELKGARVTPPLESGLLPGVLREELLERGAIREQVIRKDDLPRVDRIWLISSLRGWRSATQSRSR
jgi:para-aminobenzoate synthetase/4-amino-4-deoxychorismate lyase